MNKTDQIQCGYVAILGRPNVGKSTFINAVLQFKLSIVTPKPQTTRHKILGIHSTDDCQMLFLDTPGIMEPKYALHDFLLKAAEAAARDADVILYIIEAGKKIATEDKVLLKKMAEKNKPVIVAINKVDIFNKSLLLPLIEDLAKMNLTPHIIPVSAKTRDGIDGLLKVITENLPISAPFYPQDQLTTAPERFFVSEIIREKVFQLYGEEIPYSTAIRIDAFEERKGRKDFIRATILVARESQKGILIGATGNALKKVGMLSRKDIETFLDRPVYLELFVAVRPKWREKPDILKKLGY